MSEAETALIVYAKPRAGIQTCLYWSCGFALWCSKVGSDVAVHGL